MRMRVQLVKRARAAEICLDYLYTANEVIERKGYGIKKKKEKKNTKNHLSIDYTRCVAR